MVSRLMAVVMGRSEIPTALHRVLSTNSWRAATTAILWTANVRCAEW